MMTSSSYDFVVVGGGTAGLVVASRLSEDPTKQVLVLEAGADTRDDLRVRIPGLCMGLLSSDLDWGFSSEPQVCLNDRVVSLNQGKALGGSSAINFLVFVPPMPSVIDSWESPLGNVGWNWENLRHYLAKSYTSPPIDDSLILESLGIDGWTERAKTNGPIRTSFPGDPSHPVRKAWADTFRDSGHYVSHDPFHCPSVGSFSSISSVDPNTNQRSFSTTAYYYPVKSRNNLEVVTNAFVKKVVLDGQKQGNQSTKAVGVVYEHEGELIEVACKKDVIMAAGALQTPKILELSGIGHGDVLKKHGIDTIVDLPGVGENLHDHLMCSISFAAADDLDTFDPLIRQEPDAIANAMKQYTQHGSGPLSSLGVYTYAYLPVLEHVPTEGRKRLLQLLETNRPNARQKSTPAQAQAQAYYQIAEANLLDPNQPSCAYLSFIAQFVGSFKSNTKSFSISAMHSQPLSRGSVHIQSSNAAHKPTIDPNYLSNPLDLEIFAENMLHIETMVRMSPLHHLVKEPVTHRDPDSDLTDIEAARNWIRKNGQSMWHYVGSCSSKWDPAERQLHPVAICLQVPVLAYEAVERAQGSLWLCMCQTSDPRDLPLRFKIGYLC
ncbi:putative GMC oxidoreductase [Xylariomycetidae sp. FL0641]|nr:putative GMC oxidoreductase [Xylariomycetidae sp. FL0641]